MTDGEIGELTISDPPTQAEVQALRDACEELADDVRNLSTLIHLLRLALVSGIDRRCLTSEFYLTAKCTSGR